ncbi:uncharacterized protein LOC143362735 [Halictus rubicundus]|uniref:uncharacterized protein LOC143362735 n=1 Tax=Halictus rubicundus TaxID=77578 RepID=UPI00403599DC
MPISLRILCLVTLVLCNIHGSLEHEIPRRSFLSRRAIDGTRGRKYFDPEEEGVFDSYGSAGGQYDPYEEKTDFSDIRRNVPGEPGIDYPAYTTLPQTGFTCEGRSRGYYADEVAGCQVFHVCHDVLVSSFLCPIGSLFSQKLLTCDWWTKVDCSSSGKYIDVNRNSYQQDDDEMIRNAYAMISLQSGTDVTKDGLVDPDRTGSIVDYQRIPGRLFDIGPSDATGNDLRNTFEDYPRPIVRNFLPPYQTKSRKPETSPNYQGRFYPPEKNRSPYEDSPIIRVQKIGDHGEQRPRSFQESYRRPNEFTNHFQPSYAPTVPTVTTTTRRFYSPTVPTTFRPSTVAYNKLDQAIDSSEYYFSHSGTKSLVTPPTRIFPDDNGRIDSARKTDQDDYNRRRSYEDDYGEEDIGDDGPGKSKERFQVRVADDLQFNHTNAHERSPLYSEDYRGFDEEGIEDIETRGSIGLGHALRQPFRGISVQQQNPVKDKSKFGKTDIEESKADYQHTLVRPGSTVADEEEQTTEQYQRDDLRSPDNLEPSTTPPFVESTVKASAASFNATPGEPEKEKDVTDGINRPGEFLRSPENRRKFQIKVPDLSEMSSLLIRYSTIDDVPYSGTRTTELPRLQNTFSDDYVDQPTTRDEYSNYEGGEKFSRIQSYHTTQARPLVSSTGQRFSSPSSDHLISKDSPFRSSSFSRNSTREKTVDNPERIEIPIDDERSICSNQPGKPCNATSGVESTLPTESVTQRFNERAPSVTKSSSIEFSTLTPSPETENGRKVIESSTANAILGSIPPETLKQIEENIDRNNSPYQVTLTVNKDEDLVPHDDLISKLVAEQAKETSTLNDRTHELEVVKFVESETPTTTAPEITTVNNLDMDYYQNTEDNFTGEFKDSLKNFSTVSLLQLMSELLRLDRAPRPFSLGNDRSQTQSWGAQMIAKDVNSSVQTEEKDYSKLEATPAPKSSAPFKEKILDKLSENFGEPLYKTGRYLELPQPERALDFQTGQPIKTLKKEEESTTEILDKTVESFPEVSTETSTTTTTPKTTLTTESTKTVVQTEFLPSIGFSFDTDEGREEYVEAVLGGLIEPQPAESEKKETVVGLTGETIAPKNGTSDGNTEKVVEEVNSSEEGVSTLKKV